jgi:glyoxylase-like metal-dependent hydrolase (beta-lactamase superfamily II)
MTAEPQTDAVGIDGLHSTTPGTLSFASSTEVRAFVLERPAGSLLVYSTGELAGDEALLRAHGVERQYLNHWHEAWIGLPPASLRLPLIHHAAEDARVREHGGDGRTFDRRFTLDDDFEAIPIPGHTPGATAYLWDNGAHRMLFTGDSLALDGDDWRVAVLGDSDRAAYVESLELIRELDFDVLVPWASSVGGPTVSHVTPAQRRERLDAILERVRAGSDR